MTPRDPNPYQELLYQEVIRLGVTVAYADGPTPSQTLNVALAPLLLLRRRLQGFNILHIHWVFQFTLPWAGRSRLGPLVMQWWFGVYLRAARALGYRIVWTAHDLLPHAKVFFDDERAHRMLLRRADLVIALSDATASQLATGGARRLRTVRSGPYVVDHSEQPDRPEVRARFGFHEADDVFLLIGRIDRYKGADLLLEAASRLPSKSRIKVLVAGMCSDPSYQAELAERAVAASDRVLVRLEWLPEEEVAACLRAADFAVFPFREVTNSSSIVLAHSAGLPVVIPRLANLADIPPDSALLYDLHEDLRDVLERASRISRPVRTEMAAAGLRRASSATWVDAARATVESYQALLG